MDFTDPNIPAIDKALHLAFQAHEGQVDKQGAPIILHVLRVAMKAPDRFTRTIALLHDVVEDSPVTLDDLRAFGFSEPIIVAVDLLTRREEETYQDYLIRVRSSETARRIKCLDLSDNTAEWRGPLDEVHKKRYANAKEFLYHNWGDFSFGRLTC